MNKNKKFYFTQISAPVLGLAVCFLVSEVMSHVLFQIFQEKNAAYIATFVFFIFVSLGFSMFLWGKILVLFGILSKDESKGYPFSKPWEKKMAIVMQIDYDDGKAYKPMKRKTLPDGTSVEYLHDPFSRRIAKKVSQWHDCRKVSLARADSPARGV